MNVVAICVKTLLRLNGRHRFIEGLELNLSEVAVITRGHVVRESYDGSLSFAEVFLSLDEEIIPVWPVVGFPVLCLCSD